MKKFTTILCALLLCCLVSATFVACGGNNVNWIQVNSLAQLQEALSNKSAHIRLTDNIALSSAIEVTHSCTIDLNEHKLTQDATDNSTLARQVLIRVSGKDAKDTVNVTIKNGELAKENSGSAVTPAFSSTYNSNVMLDNVTINSNSQGVVASWGSHLSLKDSKITSKWQAVGTNNDQSGIGNTIDINNCKLISTSDVSVFVSNYTMLNINRSTIKGLTGMHILLGDINVRNSEIIATSTYNPYTTSDIKASGTKENEGSAICVRTNLYYDKSYKSNELKLNFVDNTITAASDVDVSIYNCNNAKGYIPAQDTEGVKVVDENKIAVDYFKNKDLTVKTYQYVDGALTPVQ